MTFDPAAVASQFTAIQRFRQTEQIFRRQSEAQLETTMKPLVDDLFAKLGIQDIETEQDSDYNDEGRMTISSHYNLHLQAGANEPAYLSLSCGWEEFLETACCYQADPEGDEPDFYDSLQFDGIEDADNQAKARALHASLLINQLDSHSYDMAIAALDDRCVVVYREKDNPWEFGYD